MEKEMLPVAAAGGFDGGDDDRLQSAKSTLLRLGCKRFGPTTPEIEKQIGDVADFRRAEELFTRLLEVASWQELFSSQ